MESRGHNRINWISNVILNKKVMKIIEYSCLFCTWIFTIIGCVITYKMIKNEKTN